MNAKFFMEALNDISDEFIMEASDIDGIKENFQTWDENTSDKPKKTKCIKLRKALIAAAIIIAIIFTANVAAVAFGIDTISLLKDFGDRMLGLDVGEKTDFRGVTIVKAGQSTDFSDFEEFYEKTGFDILYPSKFPEDVRLTKISVSDGSMDENYNYISEYNEIYIVFNDANYTFLVRTNPNTSKDFLNNPKLQIKELNGYEFYVFDLEETHGNANCYFFYNDMTYYIKAPTMEDLNIIITNIKEYEN